MQLISDEYRKLNEKLHEDNRFYGVSGLKHVEKVLGLSKVYQTQDILDYGCGKSTLALNLPFTIKEYDPCIKKHSALPEPADIVICTDVLEHIEPDCISDVLNHIVRLNKKAAYINIATRPAKKLLPDGRNAHILVKPSSWWIQEFNSRFDIINFMKTSDDECYFLVHPLKQEVKQNAA